MYMNKQVFVALICSSSNTFKFMTFMNCKTSNIILLQLKFNLLPLFVCVYLTIFFKHSPCLAMTTAYIAFTSLIETFTHLFTSTILSLPNNTVTYQLRDNNLDIFFLDVISTFS